MRTVLHYDGTCDSTEEWTFLNYYKTILKNPNVGPPKLFSWHFDTDERYQISVIYFKLLRDANCDARQEMPCKVMSNVLHKAFGMADDSLIERIFSALRIINVVPLRTWISVISLFLRGTLNEKIKYCYNVYDLMGKGEIRREQMLNLLRTSVFKHHDEDVEETVRDLVDTIMKKIDIDKDGIVSFEDYKHSIEQNPMLLECFGQCLPDRKHVYAFLLTFTNKINDF